MAQDQKFKNVFDLISEEIHSIVASDTSFYAGYTIELTSELVYSKKIKYSPKTIYIVIKFLRASTYYNQTSLPVTLTVLAEQNSFEVARVLMMDFVTTFNLKKDKDENILQKYETPVVVNNFNEVGNGFRSLFSISCGFLISTDNNPITEIVFHWGDGNGTEENPLNRQEIIKPLNSTFSIVNQLDSQGFFSSKNLATSVAQVFSFTVTFLTYRFQSSHMFHIILGMVNGNSNVENDINYNFNDTIFNLELHFKDGSSIRKDMRLSNITGTQPVDGLPTDNYSFAC